jgi:hypothetical protein
VLSPADLEGGENERLGPGLVGCDDDDVVVYGFGSPDCPA